MPTHNEFIPFHRPAIDEEEIQSVVETLKSGWLTTGPKVKRFEEDFRQVCGLQACGCGELRNRGSAPRTGCHRN